MPAACSVLDCLKPRRNGTSPYCEMHYSRVKRHGSPDAVHKDHRPFADRWRDHIKVIDDCWVWQGGTSRGYGITSEGRGQVFLVHRAVYMLSVGEIPDELELDHLCRNRACCNPDHLEAVTHARNVERGEAGIANSSKTHCVHGHEFTPENTIRRGSARQCRECARTASREAMRAKRGTSPDAVHNREKTHCKRGHRFSPENTRIGGRGQRVCRACEREAQRRYKAKNATPA